MKTKFFVALAGIAIVATGCVRTVTDTHTAAVPLQQDRVEGRYQRTVDQVYQASVQVIQHNGVVLTEYIPHDTTNTVRSLLGKANQCDVWLRVPSSEGRNRPSVRRDRQCPGRKGSFLKSGAG